MQDTTASTPPEAAPARTKEPGHETILVVEDEDIIRHPIRIALERNGYRVLEAVNGEEAVHLCHTRSEPIQLVITDILMPRMTGPELVQNLSRARPNIKVLFISGYSRACNTSCLSKDSEHNFLQKPFTHLEILFKVRQILDSPA